MEKDSGVDNRTPEQRRADALAEHGKATQFGGDRGNPQSQNAGSNKPWSVHNSVRYFSAQAVDEDEQPIDEETRKRPMKKMLGRNPTRAERIALKVVQQAEAGEIRAIEFVTERVDGKVAQTNINADLAQIQNMTDEQIHEQLNRFYTQRAAADPAGSSGDGNGTSAPEASETTA